MSEAGMWWAAGALVVGVGQQCPAPVAGADTGTTNDHSGKADRAIIGGFTKPSPRKALESTRSRRADPKGGLGSHRVTRTPASPLKHYRMRRRRTGGYRG